MDVVNARFAGAGARMRTRFGSLEVQAAGVNLRRWRRVVRVCLVGCLSAGVRRDLCSVIMVARMITEHRYCPDLRKLP